MQLLVPSVAAMTLVAAGISLTLHAESKPSLETVEKVDLERYMGRWYEIAKIPNRFQRKCARNTTAEYALRPDGRVTVVNRCTQKDGDESVSRGLARVVDAATNAKLKVSFVNLLGVRLFWGNYWIIGLDSGYRWVLVGEPERKYGWILAREPRLTPEQWDRARSTLRARGYDPSRFVTTLH
ncbi:MAG: lipocalin family protein [Acidobacteriota bacterium]|jgi:apolipoprotein D and lipocalin family protein|nr:lipocalin family protein [Acidobacteriota bacterium]